MKVILLFLATFFITTVAHASDACVLIALNASQRQVFSQYGYVQGFKTGCLVVEQDNNTVYEWDGISYHAIASASGVIVPPGSAGGIPYYSSAAVITGSTVGSAGQCLKSGGVGAPTWGACVSSITTGNLTDAGTDGITVTGGTGAVVGSGTSFAQHVSDSSHNGYLSSTDWSTFNGKQNALSFGDLSDVGTDGITITSGIGSVIGSGTSFAQHVSDSSHNGYLSSTDWSTFNSKVSGAAGLDTQVQYNSSGAFAGSADLVFDGAVPSLILKAVEGIQFGTSDAFARKQIWNNMTNSVFREGSWQADGDATSKTSEGIVIYGFTLA